MPRRQAGPRQQPARPADEPFRRPTASVDRPRYDFEEDEDYASQEPERRRGGVLLPIVIALLVVGALLAGICLPDWKAWAAASEARSRRSSPRWWAPLPA